MQSLKANVLTWNIVINNKNRKDTHKKKKKQFRIVKVTIDVPRVKK